MRPELTFNWVEHAVSSIIFKNAKQVQEFVGASGEQESRRIAFIEASTKGVVPGDLFFF
jgi:hypothetical protein